MDYFVSLPFVFRFPPDSEFGFNAHVYDACQILGKLGAFLCFERRRKPRNRQFFS